MVTDMSGSSTSGRSLFIGRAEPWSATGRAALDETDDPTVIRVRGWDREPAAGPQEAPVLARLAVAVMLAVPPMIVVALALVIATR